ADVAACAIEMDMQRGRHSHLAEKPRDAGKIRIGNPGAIITLRMRGVVAENGHGPFPIPKADQRNDGVDRAFRGGAQLRIAAGRIAHAAKFPVRPEDTPVGGDLGYWGLAEAKMSERLSLWQRATNGRGQVGERLALERAFVLARVHAGALEDSFR